MFNICNGQVGGISISFPLKPNVLCGNLANFSLLVLYKLNYELNTAAPLQGHGTLELSFPVQLGFGSCNSTYMFG